MKFSHMRWGETATCKNKSLLVWVKAIENIEHELHAQLCSPN